MTSKLFREIILDPDGQKVIEREKPLVTLSIRHEIRPSDEIADRLDYRERDDQLIGIAYAFRRTNPDADVRVLTNDTGPMASARMLGMESIAVPNEWLLAPKSTAAERRITALETQVARLRDAEPAFSIYFVGATGAPIERLEAEIVRYDPLGEGDVSELMSRIRSKFPLASHFGPAEPSSRSVSGLGFSRPQVFVPATEKEKTSYREEYPKWLAECESKLRSFHELLQQGEGIPRFHFVATNEGARPGKDVLVSVKAQGDFMIMPPPYRSAEDREKAPVSLALPKPPSTPRGTWRFDDLLGRSAYLMRDVGGFIGGPSVAHLVPEPFTLPNLDTPKHDPNAFYYKPVRPRSPVSECDLVCEQWRHGVEPESFAGEVIVEKEEGSVAGALECWIHAENLSDPIVKRVPVRINIRRAGAFDAANNQVEFLLAGIHL